MGTWSSIERLDSRVYSFSDRWGEQVLERSWLLGWEPTAGAQPDPYPGDGAIRANLPVRPQQRLETAVHSPSGQAADAFLKLYVCRTVTLEPLRERPYTWLVRARYTSEIFPWASTDTWGAQHVKQTRVTSSRTVSMYRQQSGTGFLPADGAVSWPPSNDMGHTRVDINGNPRRYQVVQQQITIETERDRTSNDSQTANSVQDPAWSTLAANFVNKRNDATFLGWPKGSLLMTGITATLDSELWRISTTFLYDQWFHLEQVPISAPNGMPIMMNGATIAGVPQNQCDKVVWFQPFPDLADFLNLYDANSSATGPVNVQFLRDGPNRIP